MNNKLIVEDISRKNQLKLHRNASLDSTSSSTLRVKKIKLYNEYTPLIKMNQNKKNILDFPICMSLFTKNHSLSEKDSKMKLNSSHKFNLNYPGLNNNNLKNNKQNELLLPRSKQIISRNLIGKGLSFSPVNSLIKSSILSISKFPVLSNNNILLKKINHSPLYRLSSNISKDTKILKKYKYNLKFSSMSNGTIEQDISAANSVKNTSSGNINYLNQKINNNYSIPFPLVSSRYNDTKNKKIIKFPNKNINETNKINEELFNKKIIKSISKNYEHKDTLKRDNKLKGINGNDIIVERRDISIKQNELNENKSSKIKINTKKNKIEKICFKSGEKEIKIQDNKENDINKVFKRSPSKRKTLSVQSKEDNEDEKNNENEKYPVSLMIDREKLEKLKNNKYYLAVYNKKTIDIYRKNLFLNGLNKKLNEKTINNRINAKIFLRKTEMLINEKEYIKKIITKEEKKFKKYEDLFSKDKISIYFQEELKNQKKMKKNDDIYIEMNNLNINVEYNCNFVHPLIHYLFNKIEFGEITIKLPKIKIPQKKISALNIAKTLNPINNYVRQYSLPTKNNNNDKDSDEGFEKKKTKFNNKKYSKWIKIPNNLMIIHNYILKSLLFDNEEIRKKNNPTKKKKISNVSAFNYKMFNRNTSKRLSALNLKCLKNENEIQFNKQLIKRRSSISFEDIKNTLKKQLYQKSSDPENLLSVLKHSNFFKKNKSNKDFADSIKNKIKIKKQKEENMINLEDLYFELIKLLIEGNNKAFQKYFIKNQHYIDINQELFDGNTLLILSAREGNYYITKFLCEQKADVNIQNYSGNTALHFAIGKQFYAIADILTRYGATEYIKNIRGLSPWDCIDNHIE